MARTKLTGRREPDWLRRIRRAVLEGLKLQIPSLERQRLLVRLASAAQREKEILERLIEIRRIEVELIAGKQLKQAKRA